MPLQKGKIVVNRFNLKHGGMLFPLKLLNIVMADDKKIRDGRDKSKVSKEEDYEVKYMAEKLGVSAEKIRAAIALVGNERARVEAYIRKSEA
jgi:hypothetical protein